MKPNLTYFLIFAMLTLLDGMFSYLSGKTTGLAELIFGAIFLITLPFFKKDKKAIYLCALASSVSLLILYGYLFATATYFFPALLAILSFFISLSLFFILFQ